MKAHPNQGHRDIFESFAHVQKTTSEALRDTTPLSNQRFDITLASADLRSALSGSANSSDPNLFHARGGSNINKMGPPVLHRFTRAHQSPPVNIEMGPLPSSSTTCPHNSFVIGHHRTCSDGPRIAPMAPSDCA